MHSYNRAMISTDSLIAADYRRVLQDIESVCARSGRSKSSVTLVAVVKYATIKWVQTLVDLGVSELGESRPQQLVERSAMVSGSVHWHLVGHLQRNKARKVLPLTTLIHSVDSLRLLATLDRLAEDLNLQPRVLLQVNVSRETAKHGFSEQELIEHWETVVGFRHVQIEGLMTMAPYADDPEPARPVFRRLRDLRDRLAQSGPLALPQLSMGMSHDFVVAIEEGATLVRIGSRLFEGLN